MTGTWRRWLAGLNRRSAGRRGRHAAPVRLLALEDRVVPAFAGGVYVAAADVDGDGYRDIVTGPGAGHPPLVRVLGGRTGGDVWSATPYEAGFTGGVQVAAGDVNRDGAADVVVGTG